MSHPSEIARAAQRLYAAGILTFPASAKAKHPDRGIPMDGPDGPKPRWTAQYYPPNGWPTAAQHAEMFGQRDVARIFVVCGVRSQNVAAFDFDQAGYFEQWAARIPDELYDRLYIEQSQRSGGYHVAVKTTEPINSCFPARDPRKPDGNDGNIRIEVRGEGNGFTAAPSVGYQTVQGDLAALPVLTDDEYRALIDAAATFNECDPRPQMERKPRIIRDADGDELPGTRYNRESGQREVLDLFARHGWTIGNGYRASGETASITRPGATSETSGNVNADGITHIFSSNTPFEPSAAGRGNPHAPFAIYATLEHGGDFSAAGRALYREYHDKKGITAMIGAPALADDHEQEEPVRISAWERFKARAVNLADVIENGIEPVEPFDPDEPDLLAGCVTCIVGGPEQGKTVLAAHKIIRALQAGKRALLIDEEMGVRLTAERLDAMGATRADLSRLIYFPFALDAFSGNLNEMAATIIEGIVSEHIDLVVLDSISKLIASAGMDENSNSDATKLLGAWITPAAHVHGRTVLLLDHTTKVEDDGKYGRGAGSKLADVDVQFHIQAAVPPTRMSMGRLVLTRKKDRLSSVPATINYLAGGDGTGTLNVRIEGTDATASVKMRESDRTVLVALHGERNTPLRFAEWMKVSGRPKGTFTGSRTRLIDSYLALRRDDFYCVSTAGIEAIKDDLLRLSQTPKQSPLASETMRSVQNEVCKPLAYLAQRETDGESGGFATPETIGLNGEYSDEALPDKGNPMRYAMVSNRYADTKEDLAKDGAGVGMRGLHPLRGETTHTSPPNAPNFIPDEIAGGAASDDEETVI